MSDRHDDKPIPIYTTSGSKRKLACMIKLNGITVLSYFDKGEYKGSIPLDEVIRMSYIEDVPEFKIPGKYK